MSNFSKYLISFICAILIIGFMITAPNDSGSHYGGTHASLGLFLLFSGLILFLPGLIMALINSTRKAGQVTLAASGIIFLLGFGVCTLS